MTISLTHDCQLRCDYCYAGEKRRKYIDTATAHRAVDFAFQYPSKHKILSFFGGEPLMEWELLQSSTLKAEQKAREGGIVLIKTLTTNGLLLNEEKVLWLSLHGFHIALSMDGNEQMHGTHRRYASGESCYEQVMQSHALIQKYFKPDHQSVIIVITPQNIDHLFDSVVELANEYGVRDITLSPNLYASWEGCYDVWRQQYERIGDLVIDSYAAGDPIAVSFIERKMDALRYGHCHVCSFGEMSIAVAPSGNIYPCERLIGDDDGKLTLGNVFTGFDTQKRREILFARGSAFDECLTCEIQDWCQNSCGCTNYAQSGSINMPTPILCFNEKLSVSVAKRVLSHL